jgi:TRAP-type C4-dicarboxylate transport system permease small subunit
MSLLHGLLWPFQTWNDIVLKVGRWISIVAIGLMVVAILVQVFFRYILNNALPWPDEAARFMMLWLTGLMAPMAYRRGGFVAIDMLIEALPKGLGTLLSLMLLLISAFVLAFAVPIGLGELTGFSAKFNTASLYIPTTLDFSEWYRVPRWWMMLSLFVGVVLLLIVNIELILRTMITMMGGTVKDLAPPEDEIMAE